MPGGRGGRLPLAPSVVQDAFTSLRIAQQDSRTMRGSLPDRTLVRMSSLSPISLVFATALIAPAPVAMAQAATPRLDVGVARVEITPDFPVRLTGYVVRPLEWEGIEQRVYA